MVSIKECSPLDETLREGARQMLLKAIEAEAADYVEAHQQEVDKDGRRLVVRNGYARQRSIVTGVGTLQVSAPRVADRRVDEQGRKFRFTSRILPPYLRRTKSVEELIPWLYLKGISTGDFSEALAALVGPDAPGLSATTVVRLKEVWRREYETWSKRSLGSQRFVYIWADGIYSNIRLDDERQCLLVVIGALADGRKQLLAVHDGFRESELSWTEMLEDLKARGLKLPPKLAVGDGGLGFWAALRKVYPATHEQRCWVHKTANVLDKLPKSMQGKAKQALHDIYLAQSRKVAGQAFDRFVALYLRKFPKAVACLEKDRKALLEFYDFPAEHWGHLRTTNPIESTFATVRLRQLRTKGCGSREASLTMAFMLTRQAERHWRRLNGSELIVHVLEGKVFQDGVLVQDRAA
ncbi:MAG: IS256 family transposase [Hyphomicrobium sp.]